MTTSPASAIGGRTRLRSSWRFAFALLSAALYTASFPTWNLSYLAWVALIPLLLALRGAGVLSAAALGLLWGTATLWGMGHWVPIAVSTYWGQPVWFGLAFSMIGSIVFLGWYGAGFAVCAARLGSAWMGAMRVTMLATTWVSWEFARGRLLSGDPWLLIGYALGPHLEWIQIAELGSVYAVSFVVVFVNASLVEAIVAGQDSTGPSRVRAIAVAVAPAAFMLVAVYAYGLLAMGRVWPGSPHVPVMIVQGNNDPGWQWREEHFGRSLDPYLRLSLEGAERWRPEVIVWPESALTFFLAREPELRAAIGRMLAETGAELIVGAPHVEDPDPARPQYFNSAFLVKPGGEIAGRYDKEHLLPFGEYFPLRTIELLRRRFERVRTFTPGNGETLLDTRMGKAAVVICFEAIFPELVRERMARGAEVLVNLSNDAWLGPRAGPEQHLAMVVFRAVENRTWVVRATTTGVSAVIDPYGRVQTRSPLLQPALLGAAIVPLRVPTLYERMGDVFAYACVLLTTAAMLAPARRSMGPDALQEVAQVDS